MYLFDEIIVDMVINLKEKKIVCENVCLKIIHYIQSTFHIFHELVNLKHTHIKKKKNK